MRRWLGTAVLFLICVIAVSGTMYAYLLRFGNKAVYVERKRWNPASAAELDFDAARLDAALAYVDARLPTARSLVVLRDRRTAIEKYFLKGSPDAAEYLHGLEIPVLQLLVGAAIDEGLIAGTGARVVDLLGLHDAMPHAAVLTVGDLIHVQAAPAWGMPGDGVRDLLYAHDRTAVALATAADGAGRARVAACAWLLRRVIERASGMGFHEFARRRLYVPLGMTSPRPARVAAEELMGIRLGALDLAKLGQLVADGGRWEGEQRIARLWIDAEMLRAGVPVAAEPAAGDWNAVVVNGYRGYLARGDGGQYLVIVPRLALVTATTSESTFPLPRDQGRERLFALVAHAAFGEVEPERPREGSGWRAGSGYVPPNVLASAPVPPDILEFIDEFARDVARHDPRRVARHYARAYHNPGIGFTTAGAFWGRIYAGGPGDVESVRIDAVRVEGGRAYLRGEMKLAYRDMSRGSLGRFPLDNLIRLRGRWRWFGAPPEAAILDRDEYFDAEAPPGIDAFLARCGTALARREPAPECFAASFAVDGQGPGAIRALLAPLFADAAGPVLHVSALRAGGAGWSVDGYLSGSALGAIPLPPGLRIVPDGEGWRWDAAGR